MTGKSVPDIVIKIMWFIIDAAHGLVEGVFGDVADQIEGCISSPVDLALAFRKAYLIWKSAEPNKIYKILMTIGSSLLVDSFNIIWFCWGIVDAFKGVGVTITAILTL